MAYVNVPKDLSRLKTKVMFNLTTRQLVCFGFGCLLGVPLFFFLKRYASTSAAALCMVLVMLPFFLLAMYEKNGQPLEKIIHNYVQVRFVRPRHRPYQTDNYYAVLKRQYHLNKEVQHIVHKNDKTGTKIKAKADPRRAERDCRGHRAGKTGRQA